jgi:outer membrane protein insertion porin family
LEQPTESAKKPSSSRPSRRKRLLRIAISLLLIALAVVLAAVIFIRSGKLNRYIAGQVKQALAEFGVRTEIGGFELSWGPRTATLEGLKFYNQQTGQLLATVDRAQLLVTIPDLYALRLRREVVFERLDLTNVQTFLDIDQQGNSNFRGLHSAPPSGPGRISFDFSKLNVTVAGGGVNVADEADKLQATITKLQVAGVLDLGTGHEKIQFTSGAGRFKYEGRDGQLDGIELTADASNSGVDIQSLVVHSPIAQATAAGRITDFSTPNYSFGLRVTASLREISRIFAPDSGLDGTATLYSQMEGRGATYRVTGSVDSDSIAAAGAHLRGLKIDSINVESDGKRITFAENRMHVDSATFSSAKGTTMADVTATGVGGVTSGGHTHATVRQLSVGHLAVPNGQLAPIRIGGISAELQNGRYRATGNLEVAGGVVQNVTIGEVKGQVVADNSSVALNHFTAAMMGGSVAGDFAMELRRGGNSHLTASIEGIQTDQLYKIIAEGNVPLAGIIDGQVDFKWPGLDVSALSGSLSAHLAGETTTTENAIALSGDVAVQAQDGSFTVNQLNLATPDSKLTATGTLSRNGDSDLQFSLTTTRAEELQTIAFSIDDLQKDMADYKPQLAGAFDVKGQISGKLSDPAIQADVNAAGVGLRDQMLGSLTGQFVFSPTDIAFQNGVLNLSSRGNVKFTYAAPRAEGATQGRLDATIDQVSIDTITAAAGLKNQTVVSGDISGEAHLTGLPGSPTGTATINLLNGTLAGQKADSATGTVTFDGRSAKLDNATVKTADGQLVASGALDLKSNDFQVQVRADNLDISQLASSFNSTVSISGVATANLQASGNTSDIWQGKVQGSAQGNNVMVNGHSAGQLQITANTDSNGRLDVNLVTGITGKPQTLKASIELRTPGRPIQVQADFADLDLSPVIAAFAPDLTGTVAATINGRLQVSGPIENKDEVMSFDELRGSLELNSAAVQLQGQPVKIQMPLTVSLNGPQVTLTGTHISGDGLDLALGGELGFSEGGHMDFTLGGTANLENLSDPEQELIFGGTVAVNAHLTGTFSDPLLEGDVKVNNLAFTGDNLPVALSSGNGHLTLAADHATLESFTALVNDGTAKATGTITLKHLQPQDWKFAITLAGVDVFFEEVQSIVDGNLTLTGDQHQQSLTGVLTIPEADYSTNFNLATLASGGGGGISFPGSSGEVGSGVALPPLRLNVDVRAPDTLLIRNDLVNAAASAALHIGGVIDEPAITGQITLDGGTIKFRAQHYYITTGTLEFPFGGATPEVNLMTEADVSGYHVNVGLSGPINDMQVELRSDPELPRSDVLSLVATGQLSSGSNLNGQQAMASTAGAVGSLLSGSLFAEPAQSLLGLNRLELDPVLEANQNPAARLTVGRQLARDLQFTYSTDLTSQQEQTVLVEYDLTSRYSAIGSYTQGGAINEGVRTDNDFTIEVRARRGFSLGYGHEAPIASHAAEILRGKGRSTLPHADVEVEHAEGIKLSSRTLKHLLPVKEQGFSRALALLGQRNLSNYLQEQGYFFATVKSRCEPEDCSGPSPHLFYDVAPGDRYELKSIQITGAGELHLSDVASDLQSKQANFIGGIIFFRTLPLIGGYARGITSNGFIRTDRETIRRKLGDLGYRSARVDGQIVKKPPSQDVDLVFKVNPGPRSTVAEIAFNGNEIITSPELVKEAPIKAGAVFSPDLAGQGAQRIKAFYAKQGFLQANAQYRVVDVEPGKVRVVFDVTEGTRSIVSQIAITGQTKTRIDSIARFLDFKTGDVLTPDQVRRSQRDLYSTGAFSEVRIHEAPIPGADDDRDRQVNVQVAEAKPVTLIYGLGYSTGAGVEGLAQVSDSNLFGRIDSASVRLRISRVEQFGQIEYTDLRPFGSKWATTVSIFYDRNSNLATFVQPRLVSGGSLSPTSIPGFGIDRFAAFIQTERKISDKNSIHVRYNFENTKLFNIQDIPIEEIAPNEQSILLGMLSVGFTRDERDSLLNPTKGQLISLEYSLATTALGGSVSFNKFFGSYQRYWKLAKKTPLLKDSVLAFAGRVGLSAPFNVHVSGTPTEAQTELPISERFFAGGPTTLRGFEFDQAGPQGILEPQNSTELPTLVPVGGDALMIYNFELRYPLTKVVSLVPFYDLGNVFTHITDIVPKNFSHTVGLGFRINTPIGPVGVDYGYLLNPPTFVSAQGILLRQPQGVINIRFGETF